MSVDFLWPVINWSYANYGTDSRGQEPGGLHYVGKSKEAKSFLFIVGLILVCQIVFFFIKNVIIFIMNYYWVILFYFIWNNCWVTFGMPNSFFIKKKYNNSYELRKVEYNCLNSIQLSLSTFN